MPQLFTTPGGVPYEFTRKRVKNINVRVRRDGTVAVSAPLRAPLADVERFLASKKNWLAQARRRALVAAAQSAAPPAVPREQALALFTRVCAELYPLFARCTGGRMPVIKVRDMKTRWGVCAPAKCQITFAQRLAEKPPEAIVYVAVHEFAHFAVPDHSPAFWAAVERVLPDWKARRALLRD